MFIWQMNAPYLLTGALLMATAMVIGWRATRTRSERPFALIPLPFGLQQLAEGVVWLTPQHDAPRPRPLMTYLYSGFSHVLWPLCTCD